VRRAIAEVLRLIRQITAPLPGVHLRSLKAAYVDFQRTGDVDVLLTALQSLPLSSPSPQRAAPAVTKPLTRDDLHLICFDFIWS